MRSTMTLTSLYLLAALGGCESREPGGGELGSDAGVDSDSGASGDASPASTPGENNPDGYPAATVTFWSRDYETEDAALDMWINGGGSVAEHSYHATLGYQATGAWRATPTPSGDMNETSAGWSGGDGSQIPRDATNVMIVSYMIYMSQPLANAISSQTGGFWHSGNKILDVFMWDGADDDGDAATRQVIKVKEHYGKVVFAHLVGGAGTDYVDDGRGQNLDFATNAEQWIWVAHVFDADAQVTRTYYKRAGDAGVTKALERYQADGPEAYVYGEHGWTLLRNNGGPASSIWGYWDDIYGISYDANSYVMLDRLRITDGWVEPPL